jgi:CBS domain-containing protein
MGQHDVLANQAEEQKRAFAKALIDDVAALEEMLGRGLFETGVRRIGAEQEMFLVDRAMSPAPIATELLARAGDPRLTTELARFNLEANLTPQTWGGSCLRALERELHEVVARARAAAHELGADVLLAGILPTLRKSDLGLDNMTPHPRYAELNRVMSRLRGGDFHVLIKGIDELETTHDNVMLESCNTSFQIHFQVTPDEFARLYNVAQAVTAPVLAAAVNSPVLLGHRLWHETRVALFQRSVDVRTSAQQARGLRPRVSFGDGWIRDSVLEIFRQDIARFRVLLSDSRIEAARAVLEQGGIPSLGALRLHTGTVYRWNRACYGVHQGKPHLRIENRVLPAGPTILDEVANAAFYFGLMSGVLEEVGRIEDHLQFDDAKHNFLAAARHGLRAQFTWLGHRTHTASELILDHLLPLARRGLVSARIDSDDIERYLGVIEARVRADQTGAQWALRSLAQMPAHSGREQRLRSLTAAMLQAQQVEQAEQPGHTWPLATLREGDEDFRSSFQTVDQFMTTDLFTVHPEDLVDLAATVMDWEHVRHVPVEDDEGRLVGLLSHRALLRMVARRGQGSDEPASVRDLMKADPVTIAPSTSTLAAMRIMQVERVGALPVVDDGKLVGIVTEHDLIRVATRVLERYLGAR